MPYPPMLVKSNMSINTAAKLVASQEEDNWNSSIHCSYYSVFQRMLHVLIDIKGYTESQIESLTRNANSHVNITQEVKTHIASPHEQHSFEAGVEYIKKMRNTADYKSQIFTRDECVECKDKAEALLKKLNSYFRNAS